MIAPRETIISALLKKLQTLTIFTTVDRVWRGVDNAEFLDKLPALYLIELPEKHAVKMRGQPAKIDLSFDIVLVLKNPEDDPPGAAINPMLDKIDTLFMPSKGEAMAGKLPDLGGLVYDVWIEGTVQKNYSYIGGRASIAVVPLHVRTYNPQ